MQCSSDQVDIVFLFNTSVVHEEPSRPLMLSLLLVDVQFKEALHGMVLPSPSETFSS